MPPPVVRDDAIALLAKEQHLSVLIVRCQRPTVRENNRLPFPPILVVNLRAVFGCDPCLGHAMPSFIGSVLGILKTNARISESHPRRPPRPAPPSCSPAASGLLYPIQAGSSTQRLPGKDKSALDGCHGDPSIRAVSFMENSWSCQLRLHWKQLALRWIMLGAPEFGELIRGFT